MKEKFVGLNVTTDTIEVVVRPTGERWSVDDAGDQGIALIVEKLRTVNPEIVVMLSRGTQELPVARDLVAAGIQCAFVPPFQVREFARAIGKFRFLENGRAELLARFAELVRPQEYSIGKEQIERLRDLKGRRLELLSMIEAEDTRLHDRSVPVHKNIRDHMEYLQKSLRQVEDEANFTVRSSAVWR
jgi:transposase